jgi:hypothetical protein
MRCSRSLIISHEGGREGRVVVDEVPEVPLADRGEGALCARHCRGAADAVADQRHFADHCTGPGSLDEPAVDHDLKAEQWARGPSP